MSKKKNVMNLYLRCAEHIVQLIAWYIFTYIVYGWLSYVTFRFSVQNSSEFPHKCCVPCVVLHLFLTLRTIQLLGWCVLLCVVWYVFFCVPEFVCSAMPKASLEYLFILIQTKSITILHVYCRLHRFCLI